MKKIEDNRGFGLIEIIVGITIILLLIVPIFDNFVMATKVNRKGLEKQSATLLASNIMESFNEFSLEELTLQLNGVTPFVLLPISSGGYTHTAYKLDTYEDGGYAEFIKGSLNELIKVSKESSPRASIEEIGGTIVYSPVEGRKELIYGLEGIADSRFTYDVVITIDSSVYSDEAKYDKVANNFSFPNLYELNSSSVSIIDPVGSNIVWSDDSESAVPITTDTLDEQAVSEFYNIHAAYLAYLENLEEDPTTPSIPPIHYSLEQIKNSINKWLYVSVTELSSTMVEILAEIVYVSDYDLNGDGGAEVLSPLQVYKGEHVKPIIAGEKHNIYVFYTPSDFNHEDKILITNDGVAANIFIANQNLASSKKLELHVMGSQSGASKVYSNMFQEDIIGTLLSEHSLYEKGQKKDRFYKTKVEIYRKDAIANNDYSNPYVILESAEGD